MAREWWQQISPDGHMRSIADHADIFVTQKEVDFIENYIHTDSNILDMACGNGRHSIELAKRGHRVYGLDYTFGLLSIANEQNCPAQFINGNMLKLPFRSGSFEAVLSMWQSLGYFASDKDNEIVITEVSRILRKGGIFVAQLNNPLSAFVHLKESGAVVENGKLSVKRETEEDGTLYRKTESFNPVTFRYKSIKESPTSDVDPVVHDMRYFTFPEINSYLVSNGLVAIALFGSVSKNPYDIFSDQMVIVAQKQS